MAKNLRKGMERAEKDPLPVKTMFEEEKLLTYQWNFEGDIDDPNWAYCMSNAVFSHKEACEFILHIGSNKDKDFWQNEVVKMMEALCTPAFVNLYIAAKDAGAIRLLVWC